MSALGRLFASVALDTAEFTGGVDKAKYKAAELATSVDKTMRDMERGIDGSMKKIGAAIAAGFAISELKNQFDGLVKFRAELQKISEVSGASVESLSKIAQGAKLAGTDMGSVEAALVKLTKGLTASNADTKDTARALEYLGISGKTAAGQLRDPGEVMLDVAKKLGTMENGSNKTALALALFGKSGAQLLPTLKELAENGELMAKVTGKQAEEAREYEKALVRLGIASSAWKNRVLQEMIVPATTLIEVFTQSATASDSLNASVSKLSANGDLQGWAEKAGYGVSELAKVLMVLGGNVSFVFKGVGAEIGGIAAQLNALVQGNGDAWARFTAIGKEMKENAAQARKDFDAWEAKIMDSKAYERLLQVNKLVNQANAGAFADQNDRRAAQGPKAPGFHGTDGDINAKENIYRTENAQLDIQIQKLTGVSELEQYITKLRENRFDKLTPKEKQALIDKEKYVLLLQRESSQMKADAADHDADVKWKESEAAAVEKLTVSIEDEVDKLKFENTLIGMNAEQRDLANEARARELTLQQNLDPVQRQAVENLLNEKRALIEQKQALEQQSRVWDDVSTRAGNFFGDLVVNGKSAFDNLKQSMKSLAQEMIALFAKRYILQMVAAGSGVSSVTALANATGGAGSGVGGYGSLANSAYGALFGGSAAGIGTGTGVGGYAAGMTADGGAISLPGAAGVNASGSAGGFGGASAMGVAGGAIAGYAVGSLANSLFGNARNQQGMQIGGAIGGGIGMAVGGPIGAAIGSALGSAVGSLVKSGGGAKSGSNAITTYNEGGIAIGSSNGKFYDVGSKETTAAGAIVASMEAQYRAAAKALGGNAASVAFGLGYDADPQGTAQNRVGANVGINGQYFIHRNENAGRDDASLQSAIQTESQRAILAALQSTELPAQVKAVLAKVDAYSASSEAIAAALNMGQAINSALESIKSFSGGADEFSVSIKAMTTGIDNAAQSSLDAMKAQLDAGADQLAAASKNGDLAQAVTLATQLRDLNKQYFTSSIGYLQQLMQSMNSVKADAYSFAQSIGAKINGLGGNVNLASQSGARIGALQQAYGGLISLGDKQSALKDYVSTVDTWLQQRIAQIGGVSSIAARASGMLQSTTLSGANPAGDITRYGIAQQYSADARAAYLGSSGAGREAAGNSYLDALNAQLQQLGSTYDRPSDQYAQEYATITQQIKELGGAGNTQQQILDATREAQQQALDYYTWAQNEYAANAATQIDAIQQQITLASDGKDIQAYIADQQTRSVALLQKILDALTKTTATSAANAAAAAPVLTPGQQAANSITGDGYWATAVRRALATS